jgi:hypothetical protein
MKRGHAEELPEWQEIADAGRRHAFDGNGKNWWDYVFYDVPWALLLIVLIVVYVLTKHGLKPSDQVSAIVGIAGLAIGHGIHEHARRSG